MCWIRKNASTLLLMLALVVGLAILAYPSFSNWWNVWHMSQAVNLYQETATGMSQEQKDVWLQQAKDYNEQLCASGVGVGCDLEGHDDVLNVNGNGVIGYLSIEKINVELPIYHDTDEAHLALGVGLFAGSSFPVGGASTHSVLAGHRGLSSALLLTDLDKMEMGDVFSVTVLDDHRYYEVDQILTVEPDQTEALRIEPGQDYCTLVTCTPYAINSHRLLVRGHRVEHSESEEKAAKPNSHGFDDMARGALLACPLMVLLVAGTLVGVSRRRKLTPEQGENHAQDADEKK